jgi:DNA-binding transcriptional LysR family regulator
MKLNSLETFLKVAEKMNITEAARELYISQPAVSKVVKNLEESLGVKLFLRDKQNGLLLTEVGKEILILARKMKLIENKMYQVAYQENQLLRGKVKVGSFPAVSTKILPQVISLFRSKFPDVKIELVEGTSNQIKKWVEERTVDFGIVSSPFDSFEYKVLYHDYMVAIIPAHHKLSGEQEINLENYQGDIIFCKGGHELALAKKFQKKDITYKENLTVQNAETLINMIKRNLGIGIISNFTLSSVRHNLTIKDIIPRVTREIGVITHSFEEVTPASKNFINFIIDTDFNDQVLFETL